MPTLWIVHRNPQSRTALAHLSGLAASEILSGAPNATEFADSPGPAVVLLGLEGDFEHELDFVHRLRARLPNCRWILLAYPEDAAEAARLFELIEPELLEAAPSARVLRASIADAFARRRAESLVERRSRARLTDRFSAWLGAVEIPGLLRALDPSLGQLPLLVRGVPGSGRALLARYVELFRIGRDSRTQRVLQGRPRDRAAALRLHARDVTDIDDLVQRMLHADSRSGAGGLTVWIDEIDALSVSTQNALAEWIIHQSPTGAIGEGPLHWIATAGPSCWQDPLEPALARSFAPLVIEIPALGDDPDLLPAFAREIARDWSATVAGPARHLSTDALARLATHSWQGDRSEVEAVLRATFAATSRDPIEAGDLRLDPNRFETTRHPTGTEVADTPEEGRPLDAPLIEVIAREDESAEPGTEIEPANWLETPDTEIAAPPESASPEDSPVDAPGVDGSDVVGSDLDGSDLGASEFDESVLLSEASFGLAAADTEDPIEAFGSSDPFEAGDEPSFEPADLPDPTWRRLARSLSHEIRNPLVSIRTFAQLLPEHYADETFRERFADLVGRDVAHIDDVVTRMQNIAEHEQKEPEAVDVSALIEGLLEERRERITQRRLLVLRELERDAPLAWAEPVALRIALAGLLDRALDSLPERGDLFVATRHIERGTAEEARLRILLRHHNPDAQGGAASDFEELRPEANVLEYVLAETIARGSGGSLTIDTSDAQESLILLELRTPS